MTSPEPSLWRLPDLWTRMARPQGPCKDARPASALCTSLHRPCSLLNPSLRCFEKTLAKSVLTMRQLGRTQTPSGARRCTSGSRSLSASASSVKVEHSSGGDVQCVRAHRDRAGQGSIHPSLNAGGVGADSSPAFARRLVSTGPSVQGLGIC